MIFKSDKKTFVKVGILIFAGLFQMNSHARLATKWSIASTSDCNGGAQGAPATQAQMNAILGNTVSPTDNVNVPSIDYTRVYGVVSTACSALAANNSINTVNVNYFCGILGAQVPSAYSYISSYWPAFYTTFQPGTNNLAPMPFATTAGPGPGVANTRYLGISLVAGDTAPSLSTSANSIPFQINYVGYLCAQ